MRWHIKNTDPQKGFFEKVLENRGLHTADAISEFLTHDRQAFHDPFLMKDMLRAVERIKNAIEKNERIIIYGDYDVDGMSGTAILLHALKKFNANVSYRIPHRLDDGYGLHQKFIDEFKTLGVSLVITVDCGISCAKQIAHAKTLGIDVIISDHHSIPEEFPHEAYAILHPLQKDCPYPFKGLTGSGVAFKLAHALLAETEHKDLIEHLTDLASFGTIADLGPLLGENRTIVTQGLHALKKTYWKGLHYLKKIAGIRDDKNPLDTTSVGFYIAPRINAAGRIAHPYIALQLLLHDDEKKAEETALQLETLNQKRREMTEKACEEAEKQIAEQIASKHAETKDAKVLIAKNPNWHTGILGLIAARIAEKYHRPAFIFHDRGEKLTASVRSPATYNVMDMLRKAGHLTESFGGHAQAAGLNITKEKFDEFCEIIRNHAENFTEQSGETSLELDCEIQPEELTLENADMLEKLQPFGVSNEEPLFALRNVKILETRSVGKKSEHLKLRFQIGKKILSGIAFRKGNQSHEIRKNAHEKTYDLAGCLQKNSFNGKTELQLQVIDLR